MIDQEQNASRTRKVTLVGSAHVGKTSIVTSMKKMEFNPDYISTIPMDISRISRKVYDKTIKIDIWDTAGQEQYRSLVPMYLQNSDIVILVYDITDIYSFYELVEWDKKLMRQH